MSGERMNESQMAALVTEWNERYLVGIDVVVMDPRGRPFMGQTTAPAVMLDSFARVRVGGCWWPLEWVTPAVTTSPGASDDIVGLAEHLYWAHCVGIGSKDSNGDPLPIWKTFATDPANAKERDAWIATASAARNWLVGPQ